MLLLVVALARAIVKKVLVRRASASVRKMKLNSKIRRKEYE
jgi:hypothetical protein